MDMTITYKSKYNEYTGCRILAGHYYNGNLALEIWSQEEGCIAKITVNPDFYIPEDYIAIKDYSENEGMVDWLKSIYMIDPDPIQVIESGWVTIPVHKLTNYGKRLIGMIK